MSRDVKEEDDVITVCEWSYGGEKGVLMAAHIPDVDGNNGTG